MTIKVLSQYSFHHCHHGHHGHQGHQLIRAIRAIKVTRVIRVKVCLKLFRRFVGFGEERLPNRKEFYDSLLQLLLSSFNMVR